MNDSSKKTPYFLDWSKKKDIALFRGSTTGCGVTIETNMRLKLVQLSKQFPDLLMSRKITKWNNRVRIDKSQSPYLQRFDVQEMKQKLQCDDSIMYTIDNKQSWLRGHLLK